MAAEVTSALGRVGDELSLGAADATDALETARPQKLQNLCELSHGCPQPLQKNVSVATREVGCCETDTVLILEPHLTQKRAIAGRSHPQTGQNIAKTLIGEAYP